MHPQTPSSGIQVEVDGNVDKSNIVIGNNNIIINQNAQETSSIDWEILRKACLDISEPRVAFTAQRFDTELYVDRKNVSDTANDFLKMQNKNIFIIVGKSGYGKSAFLWGYTQQLAKQENTAYLFCDASLNIKNENSVITTLLFDLSLVLNQKPENILPTIDMSINANQKLVIIIDAINEFTRMKDVEYILRDLNSLISHYKWIKLIISCRPHFWKYIQSQKGAIGIADKYFFCHEKSGELFVTLGKLDYAEAEAFYTKYQTKYKLKPTSYSELSYMMKIRLMEPLLLWLIAEICSGQNINERSDLIIDVEAVPEYVKKLEEHGELSQDGTDRNFLQDVFSKMFFRNGSCTNFIPRAYITDNVNLPNVDDRVYRLLRSGILKEDGTGRISFSFERFFGYYLGIQLKKIAHQGNIIECNQDEFSV
jgi:hypothetical protein